MRVCAGCRSRCRQPMPLRAHFRGGDWLPLSCLRGARFRGWAFPVARCGSVLILLSADNVLPTAEIFLCPPDKRCEVGHERLAAGRERIFHAGRHLGVDLARQQPVLFQLAECRCEHLLRDVGRPAVDFRKTQAPARMEVVEYQQRPLVPEAVDDMADRAVGVGRVCGFFHVRSGRSFFPYSTYNTSPLRLSLIHI